MASEVGALDGLRAARREAASRRDRIFLALLPAVGLIVVLYLGSLLLAGIQSLGYIPAAGMKASHWMLTVKCSTGPTFSARWG